MRSVNVGIFHDEGIGKELGKKGTESDIVFHNRKADDCIYTFMHPLEGKLSAKAQIMSGIDAAIVSFENMTPELGETILMLNAFRIKSGVVLVHPGTDVNQVVAMTRGTTLESFVVRQRDVHEIMDTLSKVEPERDESSPAIIAVDHSFSVKGVGEVVLGFVRQGTLKKHDKLNLLPCGKEIVIRSIQMHDKDFDEAGPGSRVGLCIKGATVEEMRRGSVICAPGACESSAKLNLSITKNTFYRGGPREGSFHASTGMQTVPVKVSGIDGDSLAIESGKPIIYRKGDIMALLDLNAEKVRLIGHAVL